MDQFATSIGLMLLLIAMMYFLMIRPQKKKEREIQAMRNNLMVGDEVVTIGGICGKIVKTREETVIIQVGADKIKFEIMRWGISRVVESTTRPASAKKARPVDDDDDDEIVEVKKMPRKMKKARDLDDADAAANEADNADSTDEENEK